MFLTVVTREKRLFSMVCGFLWIFNKAVRLLITRRSQVRVLSPQPPKNPEISTISGFFLCQKGETFYSFFASGGQWGGNKEIEFLKPCDLRVRKYGFFAMLVEYKDEYYFMRLKYVNMPAQERAITCPLCWLLKSHETSLAGLRRRKTSPRTFVALARATEI